MKYFGKGWANDIGERVPTPVGEPCVRCEKPIGDGDMGVTMPFWGGPVEKSEVTYPRTCLLASMGVNER